jgi:hypothetical protein
MSFSSHPPHLLLLFSLSCHCASSLPKCGGSLFFLQVPDKCSRWGGRSSDGVGMLARQRGRAHIAPSRWPFPRSQYLLSDVPSRCSEGGRGKESKVTNGPCCCHSSASAKVTSIRSMSSLSICIVVSHQVGRGRAANTVFQVFRPFGHFNLLFHVFYLDVAKLDLDVAYISKCFRHLKHLFQVFHLDVAKIDLDVAYVAMIKYAYCKPMFQVFRTYVANILS